MKNTIRTRYDLTFDEVGSWLNQHHIKPIHAKRVFRSLYRNEQQPDGYGQDFDDAFPEQPLSIHTQRTSRDGTVKMLLKLHDGYLIETVLMRYSFGNIVCVTTQVGCNLGCSFCASGLLKRQRQVTAGEMVQQIMTMNAYFAQTEPNQVVTHVVCMGTGEPFDNYDEVIRFTHIITHPHGLAIAPKHITISTAGIVPKLIQFAEEPLPVHLAVSLHAATNDLRTKIMKINQAYPLEKLMQAVDLYLAKTNRRITFEYILIADLNDQLEHADALADLLQDRHCYVNLIPYNAVMENDYRRPSQDAISAFFNRLMQRGILCTVRKELGHDIASACGQLRAQYTHETQR